MPTEHETSISARVLLFSILREKTGVSELYVEIPEPESVRAFLNRLKMEIPAVAEFHTAIRLAVNGTYATDDEVVGPGDEVAVITPVSGG